MAKSAGFCFGVNRAVNIVYTLLNEGKRVCTLGPIIHNEWLVNELMSKGARMIYALSQAQPGEVVVIRSHGAGREIYEQALKANVQLADATCPFVEKLHRIVSDAPEDAVILIVGDPQHPEVQGIIGHCNAQHYVIETLEELMQLAEIHPEFACSNVYAVSQTTFNTEIWEKCYDFIKKVYTNARFFDTICSATSIRQQEARELASRSDIMLVLGGRNSSNTSKLLNVCKAYCPSYLLEGAHELPNVPFEHAERIGVTAGASTPACIIKEVLIAMADLDNMDMDMDNEEMSFAEALEASFKTVSTDETVRGLVVGFSQNEVQVDLGTKHAGYIPLAELTDDSTAKPDQLLKVGDELDLVVMRVNDQDGTMMLSKKRFDALKGWDDIIKASEDNTIMSGIVTDVVKGGILAAINGVKVFIPASQSGVTRDEKLEKLLHQNVKLMIIEINKPRRRAVGSIRQVLREERKKLADVIWNVIEEGKEYSGVVKSLTSYGAFVDLGGVDGMIHVSELSWSRIRHPSEVLNIGDTVNVFVKSFDKEAKKISLGYKDKGEDPWSKFITGFAVGDIVDAKIVSFMPFGSFAQIVPGVDGLIHISQIADRHIAKPQDALQMGEVVKAKIIEIDEEKKRISLSIREATGGEGDGAEASEEATESTEAAPAEEASSAE